MKKKNIHLLEVTIWLFILAMIFFAGINFAKHVLQPKQIYQVQFNDVDGLIVGSPVKLMGIQVGSILSIEPIHDKVFLTFAINKKNIKLPKNSTVSVQFTGMAGSKSLEILPCDSCSKKITIIEPIRVDYILTVQDKLAEALLITSKNTLDFFRAGSKEDYENTVNYSKNSTKKLIENTEEISVILKKTNTLLLSSTSAIKDLLKSENIKPAKKLANEDKQRLLSSLKMVSLTTQRIENNLNKTNLNKLQSEFKKINKKTESINSSLPSSKKLLASIEELNNTLNRLPVDSFTSEDIKKLHSIILDINTTIEKIVQSI